MAIWAKGEPQTWSARAVEKLGGPGSPAGLVYAETVERPWGALERAGKARAVRERLLDVTAVRR